MVKEIKIKHYRRLKDISIEFSQNLNIISGVNGTCKSSILHLVANAFQDIENKDSESFSIISQCNQKWDPKIENLTKGDKDYNDPARGTRGALLEIEYYGVEGKAPFRRHNSKAHDRYRITLKYPRGSKMSLPIKPRIYLGTSRLVTFSEIEAFSPKLFRYIDNLEKQIQGNQSALSFLSKIKNEISEIKKLQKKLPQEYLEELNELYTEIARHSIKISSFSNTLISSVKQRADFQTEREGVDSNTISTGEDNLMIILYALVSLKYYYETSNLEDKSSILLIDELDATLHPNIQRKLLLKLREYSKKYQIQIIVTTHSLSVIEEAYRQKDKIIYLREGGGDSIKLLPKENTTPAIIFAQLHAEEDEKYCNKRIACLVEDDEAKELLESIFDYYRSKKKDCSKFDRYFLIITAKLGNGQLEKLICKMSWAVFAILDGDSKENIGKRIITLPGKASPEEMIARYYIENLSKNDTSDFWESEISMRISKESWFNMFKELNEQLALENKEKREVYKKHFKDNKERYKILFRAWMNEHPEEMERFYHNLCIMFDKNAQIAGIYERMGSSK